MLRGRPIFLQNMDLSTKNIGRKEKIGKIIGIPHILAIKFEHTNPKNIERFRELLFTTTVKKGNC